jgi:hypothetical protein
MVALLKGCFLVWTTALVVESSTDADELVSPIVNRELETSVVAHSWPSTPQSVFCEAFVYHNHLDGKGADFLDALTTVSSDASFAEAQETANSDSSYNAAVKRVLKATPLHGSARRLFELTLAMRAHSPQCELYRALARETLLQQAPHFLEKELDAFVVVNGKVVLEESLQSFDFQRKTVGNEDFLLPDEEVFGRTANDHAVVILYANLGTSAFAAIYHQLKKQKVPFVVRHLGVVDFEDSPDEANIGTVLQGYGVRLDIRNVEYKVFDDRTTNSGKDDEDGASGLVDLSDPNLVAPPQFLAGINLTALGLNDEEDLPTRLWSVHNNQDMHASIIPPVWRRRNLPLQAATAIVASADPLITLQQISQDLPSHASTLVHLRVPENVRDSANYLEEQKLRAGTLYINGRVHYLDQPSFNVFEILSTLREEHLAVDRMQKQFASLLPSIAALKDVQKAWTGGKLFLQGDHDDNSDDSEEGQLPEESETPIRIDVGRGWKKAVVYMNDIEKDSQYKSWSTSLRQMLMSMQYGRPPSVRRNLFTLLAVMDPINDPSNAGLNLGLQLMQNAYPARNGLLLVDKDHLKDCAAFLATDPDVKEGDPCPVEAMIDVYTTMDMMDEFRITSQAVHRLIVAAQKELVDYPGAFPSYIEYILASIRDAHDAGNFYSLHALLEIHGKLYQSFRVSSAAEARADAIRSLSIEDEDGDYLSYGHALRFAVERGLKPGMSFVNGRPLPTDIMDESVNLIFGQEQNHVMGLVYHGKIDDSSPKSIYGYLLAGDHVYKKNHPLLLGGEGEGLAYLDLKDSFGTSALLHSSSNESPTTSTPEAVFVVDGVFDFSTKVGVSVASAFLSTMESLPASSTVEKTEVGVAYRILPSTRQAAGSTLCPLFAHASLIGTASLQRVLADWNELMTLESILQKLPELSSEAQNMIASDSTKKLCSIQRYLSESLPSDNFILGNGRTFPLEMGGRITRDDIDLLLFVEIKRAKAVTKLLAKHLSWEGVEDYATVARIVSYLSVEAESKSRTNIATLLSELEGELSDLSALHLSWDSDDDTEESLQVCLSSAI